MWQACPLRAALHSGFEEWGTFILSAKGLVKPQRRNHQGDSAGAFLSGDRRGCSGLNDELLSLGLEKKNTSSALSTAFLSNSMGGKNSGHFKKMPLKIGWRASKHLELSPASQGVGPGGPEPANRSPDRSRQHSGAKSKLTAGSQSSLATR